MGAHGFMRVLVVDQDSALLTAISQTLGEYFTIDAVTTKADCLDLVRVNEFEVIVAGERLEDGSGLELLGQLARTKPDMLRIFAAERERLKLLKGRLAPFGLFRTLSYPIQPRQLLAILSAAAGIEEEASEPAPEEVQVSAAVRVPTPEALKAGNTHPPSASPAVAVAPARTSVEHASKARSTSRPVGSSGIAARTPRQPTPDALARASRLAAASRPKGYPPPLTEVSAKRSAFLVAAGVVVVIGVMALTFHVLYTPDGPPFSTKNIGPTPTTNFPPEVVKLVSDTETAFQHEDFKTARTDIAALQQIAPDHPRLPFLESLLERHEAQAKAASHSSFAPIFSRHSSAPKPVSATNAASAPSPASLPAAPAPGSESNTDSQVLGPSATREARLVQKVAPEYPEEAERAGVEGAVDLSFTVSPQGEVLDVEVIQAEPSSIFNRAATAAVRRWKYQPRTVNGVPVASNVQLHLTFKLDPKH
jgi:TonB family protein